MSISLDANTLAPKLFVHTLRPKWGVGMITAEEPERLRLQFEDGENRTFAKGYYDLLEPADVESGDFDVERVLEKLMRAVGVSEVRRQMASTSDTGERPVQLSDQVTTFTATYPKGFEDPKWISEMRGDGAKRRKKRHRAPAIAQAQRILARERMEKMIEEGHSHTLWEGVLEILRGTDLVSLKNDIKPLTELSATEQADAVRRLYEVLYGDGVMSTRFDRWTTSLERDGAAPSWLLATVVLALVQPERHLVVKPVTVRRQAKWMAPRLDIGRSPRGRVYHELVAMALAVKTSLGRESMNSRDLIDVADFMWLTLKK